MSPEVGRSAAMARIELNRIPEDGFGTVLSLYNKTPQTFALIRAVLEGAQPGIVHSDQVDAPSSAFVTNRFGFAQLFGAVDDERVTDALMAALSYDPALRGRYLLWYDPPALCRATMDALPEGIARARTRILYRFEARRFSALDPSFYAPPNDAEVVAIDVRMLPEVEGFGVQLGNRYWPTPESFLSHGIGALVRMRGQAACVCYAACVAGGVAEIDIVTQEEFKGRGLARCAAAAFIQTCLRRNVTPNWDCFDYNEPSIRLATSLGFVEVRRYPFYSINT